MEYNDVLKEFEEFQRRMFVDLFKDFSEIKEKINEGQLDGNWEIKPIEKPGMRGFIMRMSYSKPEPIRRPFPQPEPIRPLRPIPRDHREPLYELRNDNDEVTIYIELPGVNAENIELTPLENAIEINADAFSTVVALPETAINLEEMSQSYNNGILVISIPKSTKE